MFPRYSTFLNHENLYSSRPIKASSTQSFETTSGSLSSFSVQPSWNNLLKHLKLQKSSFSEDFQKLVRNILNSSNSQGIQLQNSEIDDITYQIFKHLLKISLLDQCLDDKIYSYKLTVSDVKALERYVPGTSGKGIKYHFVSKLFALISEIDEEVRRDALLNFIQAAEDTIQDKIRRAALEYDKKRDTSITDKRLKRHYIPTIKEKEISKSTNNKKKGFTETKDDSNSVLGDLLLSSATKDNTEDRNLFLNSNNQLTEEEEKQHKLQLAHDRLPWLEQKLNEIYNDIDFSKDMASNIFRALNQNCSIEDPKLQAEVFTLLGGDNFTLIGEILQKREEIVNFYRNKARSKAQNVLATDNARKNQQQQHHSRNSSPALNHNSQSQMALGIHIKTKGGEKLMKQMRKEDRKRFEKQKKIEKENQTFTDDNGNRITVRDQDHRFLISLGLDPSSLEQDRNLAMIDQNASNWYRNFDNMAKEYQKNNEFYVSWVLEKVELTRRENYVS